ncbi:phosphomannomutase CpsG, partial [Escherichia coli CB7326]
RRSSW